MYMHHTFVMFLEYDISVVSRACCAIKTVFHIAMDRVTWILSFKRIERKNVPSATKTCVKQTTTYCMCVHHTTKGLCFLRESQRNINFHSRTREGRTETERDNKPTPPRTTTTALMID